MKIDLKTEIPPPQSNPRTGQVITQATMKEGNTDIPFHGPQCSFKFALSFTFYFKLLHARVVPHLFEL